MGILKQNWNILLDVVERIGLSNLVPAPTDSELREKVRPAAELLGVQEFLEDSFALRQLREVYVLGRSGHVRAGMRVLASQLLEAVGAHDASRQAPLPTSNQLWQRIAPTMAAMGMAGLVGNPPTGADLSSLMEDYDYGRQPEQFCMDTVVRLVKESGVEAYLEHTGGGHVTIYAGPKRFLDGELRHVVSAGPGVIRGYGMPVTGHSGYWGCPIGHVAEFRIGLNSDDADVMVLPDRTDAGQVARLIVEAVRAAG